ncbi:Tetraspanin-10 [Camellia lanceoleosa]|uniref:Tetraspanin-10 n=1 Tax=Camellia lanceoleosa TaxID=1840588 RepID=A0ACC0FHF3_9ERIC|nr:Tetraspanin-10 [Camellia lanceoleosa]
MRHDDSSTTTMEINNGENRSRMKPPLMMEIKTDEDGPYFKDCEGGRNKYLGNQMDQLSDNVFDPIVLHFGCNLGLHSFGLNNTHYWEHLRSCLVKSDDSNNLSKKYKTLKQYKLAKLTPIEAGCCRPPSECGYPAVNASYYDLSFHPISSDKDCKSYKNSKEIKCYNCDSCKAGVAQYMKTEWRVVAIFNVVLFVVLSIIYFVGCCVKQNAARSHSKV